MPACSARPPHPPTSTWTWPWPLYGNSRHGDPQRLALAHYGLLESPEELLAEADDTLRQWAETAEAALPQGVDIAEALSARFDAALRGVDPAHREKLETLNGVHSNAAGFRRWLEGAPSQLRATQPISSPRVQVGRLFDDHFGAELLLADLEVVEGDAAIGQVLVQAANCSRRRVWSTTSPLEGMPPSRASRLVLPAGLPVIHLGPGPVLLGLVALQFSKCRACACHG